MSEEAAPYPQQQLFPATAMGWLRRPEYHANAWELPCGCMYVHSNGSEPNVIKQIGPDEPPTEKPEGSPA
jgi:hypothetical protein